MLIDKKDTRTSKKMILLKKDSFTTRRNYANKLEINLKGCWESSASSTRGAVVIGDVRFTVNTPVDVTDIAELADLVDTTPALDITFHKGATMLLGDTVIWGNAYRKTIPLLEELLEIVKVFPAIPDGWDGWYDIKKD